MHRQMQLFGARLHPTRVLLRQPRAAGLLRRVSLCLTLFPELEGLTVTVGATRVADGIAVLEDRIIRFDVRRRLPTHYTIGHELTHLLQGLSLVPHGEVQCDIWTLARHPLFLDEEPCYLPLPAPLRDDWRRAAGRVGRLCARAIERRPRHRTYIRWLRGRLEVLAGDWPDAVREDPQLRVP